MQRPCDMALDHLRAVPQDNQRGDGAKAAGLQVNGRAVVDLAVYHRIHQAHHVWGQFRHRRRGLWVVVRPIVAHAEVRGGLIQVHHEVFPVVFVFAFVL